MYCTQSLSAEKSHVPEEIEPSAVLRRYLRKDLHFENRVKPVNSNFCNPPHEIVIRPEEKNLGV
jgi:hypothetical protein